ncbi:DUF262 domain-containing protein [Corynebacterium genitalium]|nr:DUF262 domain-containing protein [Corynebacterium genitalium]
MESSPEMFPIAEFIKWDRDNSLRLNPSFQRSRVWKPSAKAFLIDTIIKGMPMPVVLFRTTIDRNTHQIQRDVVDGQQRLRAILEFAQGKFPLGPHSEELAGLRYPQLPPELQDRFLTYKIATSQLINANDEDVLEVFLRINSYTVPLNASEKRNAKYDSAFKWSVVETSKQVRQFWELGTYSERNRLRMLDHSFVAELYGFQMFGLRDGGEQKINTLYEVTQNGLESLPGSTQSPNLHDIEVQTREAFEVAYRLLKDFQKEPIVGAPHALLVLAAILHGLYGLPGDTLPMPSRDGILANESLAISNLDVLNHALSSESGETGRSRFVRESKTTTHRMKSRGFRFPVYVDALKPFPVFPAAYR